MFVACGIWCLADVSSVSPSSEQTHRRQTYHINLVDQTHIQRTRPHRKTVFSKLVFEFLVKLTPGPSENFSFGAWFFIILILCTYQEGEEWAGVGILSFFVILPFFVICSIFYYFVKGRFVSHEPLCGTED